MADGDLAFRSVSSPFDVDRNLRRRISEAVVSQGGVRNDDLNTFLREHLAGADIGGGSLMAVPVVEGAAPYISSSMRPADLAGTLIHPRLAAALAGEPGDDYRFSYPAYRHQIECWQQFSKAEPQSVLVTSGTGSGKTECFLVPLLDDLAREAERRGRLTGVRALMLYPLNALIASQQERLRRWTAPFQGDIRFALYNGLMTDKRVSEREIDEKKYPEQVIYRKALREDPPPILVTNTTMLEYMTIRKEDHPILQASRGLLRWIVIDEAHQYIGSAAAEVSLLLRRVLQSFGVAAADIRFVATSATIGGSGEQARAELQRYLADLAGVSVDRVQVVFGEQQKVVLPAPSSGEPLLPDELLSERFAAHPAVQSLVNRIQNEVVSLTDVERHARAAGVTAATLLESLATTARRGGPILPLRIHQFIRAVSGLWSCLNPDCFGEKPAQWPFGAISWERKLKCQHCTAPVFEVVSCRECGEPWLDAFDDGERLRSRSASPEHDEFAATSALENVADDAEGEDATPGARVAPSLGGMRRLVGTRSLDGLVARDIVSKTGEIPEKRGEGRRVWLSACADDGCCPRCHSRPTQDGREALSSFRFGAPFLMQNAIPTLLEGVNANPGREVGELPADGRQLLSFTDSRQGTARFAANIETISERSYVRSFLYHAAQRAAAPRILGSEERAGLEEERAAYEKLAVNSATFAAKLAKVEEELRGGIAAAAPWKDLVKTLAREPMVRKGIARVWDSDRDHRYESDPETLANYLLLRELARRPRRANAVETLGFAKLAFPAIDQLPEVKLPPLLKQKGWRIGDWRDFLYFLLDTTIRGRFALAISEADARWLLPRGAMLRSIVGPGQERREDGDVIWPAAHAAKGTKSNAVLALERHLNFDSAEAADRAEMNDLLSQAWNHLLPLFEGAGSTLALDLSKAEIAAVRNAWRCPVTMRVLPRLLFGRSPYGLRRNPPGASEVPIPLVMPTLPLTFPTSEAERRRLADWAQSNPEIALLRQYSVWGGLHERAATFSPYMRAEEHSAQQPPQRLRFFEDQFKRGEINLLACSTTMEMGVDIGSVEAVINTNVPPSIANYRQRVGRAGRRGQSFASSLTFARDTPLDREAFRDPISFLKRVLRAPRVTLDSGRIVQRHVNALLLARWLQEAHGELIKIKSGAFFGFSTTISDEPQPNAPVDRFVAWLRDPTRAAANQQRIEDLTRGTALAFDGTIVETTALMFADSKDAFGRQWYALRDQARSVAAEMRGGLERQMLRMAKEPLLKELAVRSILPGHGLPTSAVPFVTDCAENQTRRRNIDDEGETRRNRRYDYPSRNADVALREYAPGAEVVVDGLVWTSAGVTLNWQRPTEAEARDKIQSIRWAWYCRDCGEAGCDRVMSQNCFACGSTNLEQTHFLEPSGFRVDWRCKPHAETDVVAFIEPKPARISAREALWEPLFDPELGRGRATADGQIFYHSMGAAGNGYRICLDCGRSGEEGPGALIDHIALMPPKGGGGRCTGNDKTYAIMPSLALGHEVLTDVSEFQPSALNEIGAAWALASALREALARRLGIEARELGLAVQPRLGPLAERTHSIFLYDQSSGGAGYAPRLFDDLAEILMEALRILDCPTDCASGCSSCVLVADLYAQQEIIDRRAALEFLRKLLSRSVEPRPEDRPGAGCKLSRPVADAIARRVVQGDFVAIFASEEIEIEALSQPLFTTLFGAVNKAGAEVRLVVSLSILEQLDDSMRAGLRKASDRHGFTIWTGEAQSAANGAILLATLTRANSSAGFWTRDDGAKLIGTNWGCGTTHPIVEMSTALPTMTKLAEAEHERRIKPGDRVRMLNYDEGKAVRLFGPSLVRRVLRTELEAAGLWQPGRLATVSYADRYLKSPLSVLLMLFSAAALRDALAPEGHKVPIRICTEPLRPDRQSQTPFRLSHDWREEADRASVISELALQLGFIPTYENRNAPHGRKLSIGYDNGLGAALLFDQGFGYWRAISGDQHNFRAEPKRQAMAMLESPAFVAGQGESYIAFARTGH